MLLEVGLRSVQQDGVRGQAGARDGEPRERGKVVHLPGDALQTVVDGRRLVAGKAVQEGLRRLAAVAETAGDAAAHRRRIELEVPGHVHRHRRAGGDQPGDLLRREHLARTVLKVDEQVEQLTLCAFAGKAHQLIPGLHRQHLDGYPISQGAHLFEKILADGLAAQGVVDQHENLPRTRILAQGGSERGRVRRVFDDAVQVVRAGRDGGAIVDAAGDHGGAGKQLGPVAGDQFQGVVVGDDDAVEPRGPVFFPEQLEQPHLVGRGVVVLGVQVLDPVAGPHLGRVQH